MPPPSEFVFVFFFRGFEPLRIVSLGGIAEDTGARVSPCSCTTYSTMIHVAENL